MEKKIFIFLFVLSALYSCRQNIKTDARFSGADGEVKIIQLDPAHSHAAAAQAEHLSRIDTNVYVYTPEKEGIKPYFNQIRSFNSRKDNPTKWNEVVYSGPDYLEKMVQEKKGNVVVLAGNNRIKIDYIEHSINAGLNVFSDKPMVINKAGFERLKTAYRIAAEKGVLLFDMMTERYNLMNRVQKSLMQDTVLFGRLQHGTPEYPAVFESSVHHFYRGGKGSRPAWFFDVRQQGEGIVDVTTHLIDLTFWKSFPDQIIDYTRDIKVLSAKHRPVSITQTDFSKAASLPAIPESLAAYTKDTILTVFANGSINYQVKGVYAAVQVEWNIKPPKGGSDLRNAYAEGTKARLVISQEYGQQRPKLYIQNTKKVSDIDFQQNLEKTIARLQSVYPGISLSKGPESTEIVLPQNLKTQRDPTFRVFLNYLVKRDMPEWEVPNTLAKYFITTSALELANEKK
ncbi:MAG: putative oxidoreductase C-terminal domain-containing protein [Mangrovibacterium sp.]